jgi:hypothetical protein
VRSERLDAVVAGAAAVIPSVARDPGGRGRKRRFELIEAIESAYGGADHVHQHLALHAHVGFHEQRRRFRRELEQRSVEDRRGFFLARGDQLERCLHELVDVGLHKVDELVNRDFALRQSLV